MALVLGGTVPSDLEVALAFVAKRQGRDASSAAEWRHVLSLELGWFTPAQAARFVEASVATGLLRADGDQLRLAFDRGSVQVPRGFRPDPAAIPDTSASPPAEDPFIALVDRIAGRLGTKRSQVLETVAAVQERFGGHLEAEAAALRVALDAGLDVQDEAEAALARLMGPATAG